MNAGPGHSYSGGKHKRRRGRRSQRRSGMAHARPEHQGIFTAPMDHNYRANMGENNGNKGSRRPGFAAAFPVADPEPLPAPPEDAGSRVFAFVEDLFFLSKIQDAGRKMNVKVEFVKTEKYLTERLKNNGEEKPSLIIFDLNNTNIRPLSLIPKLKSKLKKGTSIIGFLSHVQGDLKLKAHEAGCDMVLPRSAFSQNLPQLLRRHGASGEATGAAE